MYKILETEIEELNDQGEYVKTIEQHKVFLGIRYKAIKKIFTNKITQATLDSLEAEGKVAGENKNKKSIGFNKNK